MNALREVQLNHPVEFMRLTLTYHGPLHAQSNSDTRVAEKHAIRREFHKQMYEAWSTHPVLHSLSEYYKKLPATTADDLTATFSLGKFRFIPLVTQQNWLACELDILFLRREPAGHIVDSETGDIDNRIKVLFDALRMPLKPEELPATAEPTSHETPFFCLLENDSLITGFRLESERLLYPPPSPDASGSEVQLTIRAQIKAVRLTWANMDVAG